MENRGNPRRLPWPELEALIVRQVPQLLGYVKARIPDRFRGMIHEDDILQEVWWAAYQHAGTFRMNSVEALGGWLCAIAGNKLRDALRVARSVKQGCDQRCAHRAHGLLRSSLDLLYLVGHQRTPSRDASMREATTAVGEALRNLPERQRTTIALRFQYGLSRQEIADRVGMSTYAVSGLLHRALRSLRESVGPRHRLLSTRV